MDGQRPHIDLELLTTDAELLRRAKEGTPEERQEAVEQLASRYWLVAFKSARAILDDDDAARDAAQDAAVRLLLHIGRLDGDKSLRAWFAAVGRNRAKDMCKAMRRAMQFDIDGEDAVPERQDRTTPFNLTLYNEIINAISALPLKQQVVVERHIIDGDDVADIAADLRITKAAVYERLRLAKLELRRFINWKR